MRVSWSNESLQVKVNNRELKEVDHSKYLVIAKEAFNRKNVAIEKQAKP